MKNKKLKNQKQELTLEQEKLIQLASFMALAEKVENETKDFSLNVNYNGKYVLLDLLDKRSPCIVKTLQFELSLWTVYEKQIKDFADFIDGVLQNDYLPLEDMDLPF